MTAHHAAARRETTRYTIEHRSIAYVSGPLLIIDGVSGAGYGDLVEIDTPDGDRRRGRILELDGSRAVVQVLGTTRGLDLAQTSVRLHGEAFRLGVGPGLLGRIFDGSGRPIDGEPAPLPAANDDVNGLPINPVARSYPDEFIETGISAIDGLNTLVRGQKLPIFSAAGLPAMELVAQIVERARAASEDGGAQPFVVILGAMGVTRRESAFYRRRFESSGALRRTVAFINHADDPAIERLLTPRLALTAAEHFAYEQGMHVLVVLTDMTSYCEALREISAARQEVPGRRGYPGYMYTDLASIYERAGRIHGRSGSVTQLIVLSMPDDDITHPIPDITGYITEGQIVLSRDLHRRGIAPPIDVLPSLSRLMNAGIGTGRTRAEHRGLADQVYALYARGRSIRRLVAIVGEGALTDEDRRHLSFADSFERSFVGQGATARAIGETLDVAWALLEPFPDHELTRLGSAALASRPVRADGSDGSEVHPIG